MSTLVFLGHYTQDFTLDSVNEKDIMKFLIDNANKKEITEPKEPFVFKDGMHIDDIIEEYLETHIYPVPDYTEEELEKTDFTKSVSVTLSLEIPIDLTEDYGSCEASFWDQGDYDKTLQDEFIEYIEKHVKELDLQEGDYADEDLENDILYEDGDFVPMADMIQWNYLGHLYSEFVEWRQKEQQKHFNLPFYETYTHEFSLESFKDLQEFTETPLDSKRMLKYLYENTTIREQEDAWDLTDKFTLGSMVVGFLEKKVLPLLPNYTDKQLKETEFDTSVHVVFHLNMKVDMGTESCYTQNNSGFWNMGGCDEKEEFMNYLIDEFEEESKGEEPLRENLADDCINQHDDPLHIEYAHIADILQWRFMTARYAEFLEEEEES